MADGDVKKKPTARWVAILLPAVLALVGWTYGLIERVNNLHYEAVVNQITSEIDARKLSDQQLWAAVTEIKENTKELPAFMVEMKIVMGKLGLDGVSMR